MIQQETIEIFLTSLVRDMKEVKEKISRIETEPGEPEPLVYSIKEAAKVLGLSQNRVYELVRENKIPNKKIDGRILIPRKKLEKFINGEAV